MSKPWQNKISEEIIGTRGVFKGFITRIAEDNCKDVHVVAAHFAHLMLIEMNAMLFASIGLDEDGAIQLNRLMMKIYKDIALSADEHELFSFAEFLASAMQAYTEMKGEENEKG